MADEQKQTLLQVNLSLSDAIKEMADYQQKIDDIDIAMQRLTAEYKSGTKTREQYNQEMIRMKETKKAYSKEMGELSRVTQNQIIAEKKYAGTLKGMCAELSVAKDKLRAMKMTDPGWEEQRDYVDKLNASIKEIEQSYGVYQRDVGHYRTGLEKTKEEIAATVAQMRELIAAHKEDSPEMQKCNEQLESYNSQLASQGRDGIDAATQGISGMVGMLTLMSSAFGDDSAEAAKMQELIKKLSVAVTVLSVAMKVYQAAEKKGLIQKIAMNLQIKAATKGLTQEAAAETGSTAAKIAGAKAQTALNTAMKANPVTLIVTAVLALVAGLAALVTWLLKSTDAQKAANAAQKAYEEQLRKSEIALETLSANENARAINITKQYQDEITQMMKSGATAEEIDKKKTEMNNALLDNEIAASKERKRIEKDLADSSFANYEKQKALLSELISRKGADAKATKEQQAAVDEAYKTYLGHLNSMNEALASANNAEFQMLEANYNALVSASDKAYNRATKNLEKLSKLRQEYFKRESLVEYDYTKTAEQNAEARWKASMLYEQRIFLEAQESSKKKLENDKKYGKITLEEYNNQMRILASEYKTFQEQQNYDIAEHLRSLTEDAIKLAGGEKLEAQLAAVKSKYADAATAIRENVEMSEEEKNFYLTELAERQADEERDIRVKNEKEIADNIKKIVDNFYKDDIRQFSAEETERLELEIEKDKEIIAERKQAGLDVYADEVALATKEASLRAATLSKENALNWQSKKAQYEATREYLEKEIELYEQGTAARAALERELAELTADYNTQKVESVTEYANQALEIMSSLNDLLDNLGDAELAKYQADNDAKTASLDKRLDAGLISQKQYDKQKEKLDEELAEKEAELNRKQAIREKALSAMQIAVNTAAAIMRIWAEVPKADFGVSTGVLTALAATTGAAQLAAVLAEPLPTARIGGLVQGGTHEQGGVLVNTEGGERIISKDASKAFPELLNLISYIGKNASIPDTGYAASLLAGATSNTERNIDGTPIDYDVLADKIGERVASALADNPPRIAVDEYEQARTNYVKVEQSAKM